MIKDCRIVRSKSEAGFCLHQVMGSCLHSLSFSFVHYLSILQNVESGLCVTMGRDQGLDLLKQQACDVKSEEQRFTCKKNKIMPVKDSGLCVTASGNCFTIVSVHYSGNILVIGLKVYLSTKKCNS